jgi:hypothetical protein
MLTLLPGAPQAKTCKRPKKSAARGPPNALVSSTIGGGPLVAQHSIDGGIVLLRSSGPIAQHSRDFLRNLSVRALVAGGRRSDKRDPLIEFARVKSVDGVRVAATAGLRVLGSATPAF